MSFLFSCLLKERWLGRTLQRWEPRKRLMPTLPQLPCPNPRPVEKRTFSNLKNFACKRKVLFRMTIRRVHLRVCVQVSDSLDVAYAAALAAADPAEVREGLRGVPLEGQRRRLIDPARIVVVLLVVPLEQRLHIDCFASPGKTKQKRNSPKRKSGFLQSGRPSRCTSSMTEGRMKATVLGGLRALNSSASRAATTWLSTSR